MKKLLLISILYGIIIFSITVHSVPVEITIEYPEGAPQECVEDWSCTDWSACVNGTQTRTCTDLNECGTDENKPLEFQVCTPPLSAPSPGGGGGGGGGTPKVEGETNYGLLVLIVLVVIIFILIGSIIKGKGY